MLKPFKNSTLVSLLNKAPNEELITRLLSGTSFNANMVNANA